MQEFNIMRLQYYEKREANYFVDFFSIDIIIAVITNIDILSKYIGEKINYYVEFIGVYK